MKKSPTTFTKAALCSSIFLIPTLVFAQITTPTNFREVVELLVAILKSATAVIFTFMSVGLVYGVVLYFLNADNERKRTEIKSYLLWGIIGITVVFALWGILQILSYTVGWGQVGVVFISPPS